MPTLRPVDLPPILPQPEAKTKIESGAGCTQLDQEEVPRARKDYGPVSFGHREDIDNWGRTTGGRIQSLQPTGNGTS